MLLMLKFNHVVVGAQYLNRYLLCALELWVVIRIKYGSVVFVCKVFRPSNSLNTISTQRKVVLTVHYTLLTMVTLFVGVCHAI